MDFPICPTCQKGCLLPISNGQTTFSYWVCSMPDCAYVVSGSAMAVKYYKGSAVQHEEEKGEKRWTEFEF